MRPIVNTKQERNEEERMNVRKLKVVLIGSPEDKEAFLKNCGVRSLVWKRRCRVNRFEHHKNVVFKFSIKVSTDNRFILALCDKDILIYVNATQKKNKLNSLGSNFG